MQAHQIIENYDHRHQAKKFHQDPIDYIKILVLLTTPSSESLINFNWRWSEIENHILDIKTTLQDIYKTAYTLKDPEKNFYFLYCYVLRSNFPSPENNSEITGNVVKFPKVPSHLIQYLEHIKMIDDHEHEFLRIENPRFCLQKTSSSMRIIKTLDAHPPQKKIASLKNETPQTPGGIKKSTSSSKPIPIKDSIKGDYAAKHQTYTNTTLWRSDTTPYQKPKAATSYVPPSEHLIFSSS